MRRGITIFVAGGLLLLTACTGAVVVTQGRPPLPDRRERGSRPPPHTPPEPPSPPNRPAERPNPPPSNPPNTPPPAPPPRAVVRLMIPPGQLPDPGECRVWMPAMPPGLQPRPRSRPCAGIEAIAPTGSWIIYRPREDRRVVHVRVLDQRRRGTVIRIRIFDIDSQELVREEEPRGEPGQNDRPGDERRPPLPPREIIPPVQPPRDTTPRQQPPQPPRDSTPPERRPPPPPAPDNKPPGQPGGPTSAVTLDIPPGHLPEVGECRLWIPGLPPGRQPRPKSRACDGIVSGAPAGSWIIYRPSDDRTVVHIRIVDTRRAGVVIRIRIFDIDSQQLVREENP